MFYFKWRRKIYGTQKIESFRPIWFVDFENRVKKGHYLFDLVIFETSIVLLIRLKVFYVVYSEGSCAKQLSFCIVISKKFLFYYFAQSTETMLCI